MDQSKSPRKKIQFEVPSRQLHGHLDPRSSEQLRKRRPTPATLFLSNDQISPDDDKDGEHAEGAESRYGHSPRKGGHHSSYTPPTMSQMQTLVELHLHATEEEDEEEDEEEEGEEGIDDDENIGADGERQDAVRGHRGGGGGGLVFHVPTGTLASHGEKGVRGGHQGDAVEPTPGMTAEPEPEPPTSDSAQEDPAGASGDPYGGGKDGARPEEVTHVTFEPRRRVTWAHGPQEVAAGPSHLASPPIPTGCMCFPCLPLAPVGDKIGEPASAAPATTEAASEPEATASGPEAGVEPGGDGQGPQREATVAQRGAVTGSDMQSASKPSTHAIKAQVQFDTQSDARAASQSTAKAGIKLDTPLASDLATNPDLQAYVEPDSRSDAHRVSHASTAPGTEPFVN